jgi:CHAD domain-containing protein
VEDLEQMAHEQIEREDKYDVPSNFDLPDLSDLVPQGSIEADTFDLTARYFDTLSDDLRRHSLTLRRRTGGHDAGWHLKLPAGVARTEITVESAAGSPPRELSALLLGVRRGQRLMARALLHTTRHSQVLLDGDGQTLAEVTDDRVRATTLDDEPTVTEWRELEVELAPGAAESWLERVGRVLTAAGARPSASPSKLARALGPLPARIRPGGLAGLVDDYLQTQYDAIITGDVGLRRDENRIHSSRVAIRRIRSTLRVFEVLFDSDAALSLQTELAWYAGVLGAVRDLDVQAQRLADHLTRLPTSYVVGSVADDLAATLSAERAAAWRTLRSTMNGKRYLALLSELDRWSAEPPFTSSARRQEAESVADYVTAAEQQLGKRLQQAVERETDDDLFHSARKAAKRARYAAELAQPVLGDAASRAVEQTRDLQTLLGEHQDSVVSVALLRRLGRQAPNGFTYGVLLTQQEQLAAQTRAALVAAHR